MNRIRTDQNLIGRICLILAWFTSSGDLIFNIDIGASLRYTQLLSIVFSVVAVVACPYPKGARALVSLVAFSFINAFFIFNNNYPFRGVFYAGWLFQNILYVWAFCAWIRNENDLRWSVRASVFSAVAVAVVGLGIFVLERMGFDFYIISQPGRINGFSYEPSYFATYLIPFWVLLAYTIERKSEIWTPMGDVLLWGILTAALLLSTSRLASVSVSLWFLRMCVISIYDLLRGHFPSRVQIGFIFGLISMGIAAAVMVYGLDMDIYSYLGGTGLFETSAHSVNERTDGMLLTWELFRSSPFLGCSLGGVAVQIAAIMGLAVNSLAEAKTSEGVSVFLEVLAGTGVVGFIVLVYSFFRMSSDAFQYKGSPGVDIVCRGLVWGFIILMVILQLNQNILRPYVWYYMGLVCAASMLSYRQRGRRPVPPQRGSQPGKIA